MSLQSIAQAVWEYATRTLLEGTPSTPVNKAEEIAKAVWEYGTRDLTSTAFSGTASISGSGSLNVTSITGRAGTASISGNGLVSTITQKNVGSNLTISGNGAITLTAKKGGLGTALISIPGGVGLSPGTILIDAETGEQYIYISKPIIVKVS